MQRATILYNDRVNTYHEMVKLDALIDNKPTAARIEKLAELMIRNKQAFRELETYNNTGKFLNRHPLVKHFSTRQQLEQLLKDNPDKFLEDYSNTRENVKRYKSYLNNKKRDEEKHAKDKINLKKHQDRVEIMKEILSQVK